MLFVERMQGLTWNGALSQTVNNLCTSCQVKSAKECPEENNECKKKIFSIILGAALLSFFLPVMCHLPIRKRQEDFDNTDFIESLQQILLTLKDLERGQRNMGLQMNTLTTGFPNTYEDSFERSSMLANHEEALEEQTDIGFSNKKSAKSSKWGKFGKSHKSRCKTDPKKIPQVEVEIVTVSEMNLDKKVIAKPKNKFTTWFGTFLNDQTRRVDNPKHERRRVTRLEDRQWKKSGLDSCCGGDALQIDKHGILTEKLRGDSVDGDDSWFELDEK